MAANGEAMEVDQYPQIAENVSKTYFYGDDKSAPPGSFNAKSFLDYVELNQRRYNWNDAMTVNYAVTSMRGSAYDWFKMLRRILSAEMRNQLMASWAVFKEALMSHYNIGGMAKRPQVKVALDMAKSLPLRDFFTAAMTEFITSAEAEIDRWFLSITPANTWRTIVEAQLPAAGEGQNAVAAYRTALIPTLSTYLERLEETQNTARKEKLWDVVIQLFVRNILIDHIPYARTKEKAYELITEKPQIDNFEFFEKVALFDERNNPSARKGAGVHELKLEDEELSVEAIKKAEAKKKEPCKYCGIPGHKAKRCFKKKRDDKKKKEDAKKVNELSAPSTSHDPPIPTPPTAAATSVAMLDALSGNGSRW